jgi:hypothetical protein
VVILIPRGYKFVLLVYLLLIASYLLRWSSCPGVLIYSLQFLAFAFISSLLIFFSSSLLWFSFHFILLISF